MYGIIKRDEIFCDIALICLFMLTMQYSAKQKCVLVGDNNRQIKWHLTKKN